MNRDTPRSILIVDDDLSLSKMLSWAFEDLGYLVWSAADCREAEACARAMTFDFALLDYHLPDGNGHQLSQALHRLLPKLKIVLMSVDRHGATAEISDEPVAEAFIEKPVPLARLHRFFQASA